MSYLMMGGRPLIRRLCFFALPNNLFHYLEQRKPVQSLIDNQIIEERKHDEQIKAYNNRRQELIDAGLKIEARLKEIQTYINSCEEAIAAYDKSTNPMKDGTMERMKAACGQAFDGN